MRQSHLFSAAAYGGALAGFFLLLILAFDRPEGMAIFLLGVGLHLLFTGWMPWVRLGMKFTTVGMYVAATVLLSAGGGWFLAQRKGELVNGPFVALALAVLIIAVISLAVDRHRHPDAWRRWRESLQQASLGDLLLGRHFSA